MHISGLGIYDQSTAPGGKLRFKEIIDNIHQRVLALTDATRALVDRAVLKTVYPLLKKLAAH